MTRNTYQSGDLRKYRWRNRHGWRWWETVWLLIAAVCGGIVYWKWG